ncbi:unnamed protein product, partial [Musa textilis]
MLLCEVILGSMEQVRPGSVQNSPSSSDEYDSGVDDHVAPRCYVEWASHAHTRIHPKYVVVFKLPPNLQAEHFFDLSDVRFEKFPIRFIPDFKFLVGSEAMYTTLAGVTQPLLYTVVYMKVQDHISPMEKELLYRHHLAFQKYALTDEELLWKIRVVLGDRLLVSTLK